MELRLVLCLAFFAVAVSQCSVHGHSVHRRQASDDVNYDDFVADEASEDETQNDGDNAAVQSEPAKPPAVILTEPATFIAEPGRELLLPCKVSPDSAAVAQWYKNQVLVFMGTMKLIDDDRYSIAPNSKDLVISNPSAADAGVFRCEIAQKVPVSVNHTVLAMKPPKVTSITATNNGNVSEDKDVTLSCTVTGIPAPSVVWSLKKPDIPNQSLTERDGEFFINGNVHSMKIRRIRVDQAGLYLCYAFSKNETDQRGVVVVVNPKPRVHVPKTIVNSDINVEAVLECSAHEKPLPHIRWYKDGVLIEDSSTQFVISTQGSHSNLTVTPAVDTDFGTFTCEAENVYGKHNKSIMLVQSPVIEGFDVDGAKLSWVVRSHQPLEEIVLQLGDITGDGNITTIPVPVPESQGHKYEVTYLVENSKFPAGKYNVIVKAKNTREWGSSESIFIDLVEDIQPQYIQHASVFRTSDAHSIRSSSAVVSTILMYLLVRML